MQNIEPQGEYVLGAIANGEAPDETRLTEAYIVSIAISLKRIADRLEGITILPGEAALQSERASMEGEIEEAYAAFRWVYENGLVPSPLRPQWVSDVFNNAYASQRTARNPSTTGEAE